MKVKKTDKIKFFAVSMSFICSFSAFSQMANIDSLREIWRNEADFILKFYTANAFDTLRGLTSEEWNNGVNEIYEKINRCNTHKEYLYALRYFGALINDAHVEFSGNGVYNRKKIFQKTDTLFPVWVKSWRDGRVFAVKDFSEQLPVCSEIISINGIPAKNIAEKQRRLFPCEDRLAAAWTSSIREGDPLLWTNFANYLFCEKIRHPFTVEYKPADDTAVRTIKLSGLQREKIDIIYNENEGKEAPKEGFALLFSLGKNTVGYSKINDSIAVLKIKMFLGSTILGYLFSGMEDTGFPKKLSKIMKQIQCDGIRHLIIDLRDNPGGYLYNVYELLAFFTDEKFVASEIYKTTEQSKAEAAKLLKQSYKKLYGKKHSDVLRSMEIFHSMPDGSIFRSDTVLPMYYNCLKPVKYRYDGKTYLLTSGMSYSASVMCADLFKSYKLGLLAGESPGGYSAVSSGDGITATLPYSRFTTIKVPVFYEKTTDSYKYVEPDIPIEPTFEEWLYNKHDSLKKLLAIIMKK
ncbi:MAG: hypothetical protein LBG92_09310 [Prevotellaceae bacterium]|jgi:C-terminal processing protease CtpA/Prc|nr:hypothetical protein [Prevotellaceae bacterium]